MIVKKNFLLISLMCLFFSCKQREINSFSRRASPLSQDTNTIYGSFNPSEYFRTQEIQTDTAIHTLTFFISNSKLLYAKKRKMGKKWVSPEAWASVAATHQANYLPTYIDSLVYKLQMDGNVFRYAYSVAQMQTSNRYVSTCKQFYLFLNARDYYAIKNLLASNVTSNYNDNQISKFIQTSFGDKPIVRIELIGNKIIGKKYSLYINFIDSSNDVQTYVFSFLEGNDRIGGIQFAR